MSPCGRCGTENPPGMRFCGGCGSPLALQCPSCDGENPPTHRFCGHCGEALAPEAAPAQASAGVERRLVSVLFADLVGFTAASESRDAEDTRALLSDYFDTCRRLIALYGGTVEKFIGDAVMAVWGTPVANEDDAERAVRAALDLVAAVAELDPSLQARAGVLTGEAAVTLGAEGQGMVAGELVNTASRIQSAAEPGTVLVGEATRRASEAAIGYEPAGEHELKGKTEPVSLHRATRVLAGRRGAMRSAALEPPFVGRERELRLVKELFHACGEEGKAQLVSVVGIAGIGKSRLSWEFEKYIDGLADFFFWHRGRCLAYGDGVAYWALAEMVRMRADIAEDEAAAPALEKLRACIAEHVPDADERAWLEPRLAHLLGLAERTAPDREDLFSAWRLFFERLADARPVILVFEDLQWADTGLLDFVEYLLEWSRNHALFVLALSRPELGERRPGIGSAGRTLTTLSLEPLPEAAMERLLDGLVPGLPAELRGEILSRAEGVPLYAVETIRMLLDRGLLTREGDVYRPTGEIHSLDVPETLHALVSARLDGLDPDERRLLQDASVLGKSFTRAGIVALSGIAEADAERLLTALVRKEVLSVQVDPRSPERGHYSFLQDLLKRVAYETLAKRDRKARHLAAAAHLADAYGAGEQEIVEVIAAHYLDAYRAAPDAEDAPQIRATAREMLARAGERAASLAAADEAERYFERAAELSDGSAERAALLEQAGAMALRSARFEQARVHLERATALFESEGMTHPAARVAARLGIVEWRGGQLEDALERMERAYAVLSEDEPDADLATVAAELGRLHFFRGDRDLAERRVETAVQIAESLWLPEILSQALNTQGLIASLAGRSEQALALLRRALELALDHDLTAAALRAYLNVGDLLDRKDRCDDAIENHVQGVALARRIGDNFHGWRLAGELAWCLQRAGRWDEALEVSSGVPVDQRVWALSLLNAEMDIAAGRGEIERAGHILDEMSELGTSEDLQAREALLAATAVYRRLQGRHEEALEAAEAVLAFAKRVDISVDTKVAYAEALAAAFALGRLDAVEELVARIEAIPPGPRPPWLRAQAARFTALLRAARGEHETAEQGFKTAEALLREHGLVFPLAVVQLEHGEWLQGQDRGDDAEPLLAEARATFERLGAAPWLARLGATPDLAAVD